MEALVPDAILAQGTLIFVPTSLPLLHLNKRVTNCYNKRGTNAVVAHRLPVQRRTCIKDVKDSPDSMPHVRLQAVRHSAPHPRILNLLAANEL